MMKVFIRTSLVLAISAFVAGCGSLNRAESSRMLDARAAYGTEGAGSDLSFKEGGVEGFRSHPVPTRSRAKVAAIYAHPHEMPSRDYFWGGWISVVVEQDQWVMSKPQLVPNAKAIEELPAMLRPGSGPAPIELMPPSKSAVGGTR
jgi:hypothetical protein